MTDHETIRQLIGEADSILKRYGHEYPDQSWRSRVLALVDLLGTVKNLGIHTNSKAAKVGARERIRLYLVAHPGIIIDAPELEVVGGISEYGRRVRELRVEDGYKILTGNSNDPEMDIALTRHQYLLIDPEPDHAAARRWKLANRIRRETEGGARERLRRFLLENVAEVVTTEELAYVARSHEFGRRVRELRTEQGYAVATRFTGRPDLHMGEYVLESSDRIAEPHDRKIPFAVQKQVYARDHNGCRLCGWTRDKWKRTDPRILELHHVQEHADGGHNAPSNLVVLCSRCHDEVHAGRRPLPPDIAESDDG